MSLKRTPLYDAHLALGGKMVPFAGWELPVQYRGVVAEHQAVRERAGLFDVSHMGEILVTGPEAEKALQYLTCNDLRKLTDGKGQYNAITNPAGGVVDDIIIYRFSPERFFICVNGATTEKDFAWFTGHNPFRARFENLSLNYGQIALQGPRAAGILSRFPGAASASSLAYFGFAEMSVCGAPVIVARTGYTGEDGFEIFIPWSQTEMIWNELLRSGQPEGLVPAGLGARDSLRLEACFPLYGHELGDDITAIESGLGWIVKPEKGEFLGCSILAQQKSAGAPRSLIGFFINDAGIARQGDKVFDEAGAEIGWVTSGTKTPTVNRALGMALVKSSGASPGRKIFVEVRGRRLAAQVQPRPFYKRVKSPSP